MASGDGWTAAHTPVCTVDILDGVLREPGELVSQSQGLDQLSKNFYEENNHITFG